MKSSNPFFLGHFFADFLYKWLFVLRFKQVLKSQSTL